MLRQESFQLTSQINLLSFIYNIYNIYNIKFDFKVKLCDLMLAHHAYYEALEQRKTDRPGEAKVILLSRCRKGVNLNFN